MAAYPVAQEHWHPAHGAQGAGDTPSSTLSWEALRLPQSTQRCRQRPGTLVQDPRGVMIRSGEPSNHLDLRVFPWLEHYVLEHDGRRVSHGRHLLNTVSRDIVHMHEGSIHLDLHRTGRS
jgi:hypothetical protein